MWKRKICNFLGALCDQEQAESQAGINPTLRMWGHLMVFTNKIKYKKLQLIWVVSVCYMHPEIRSLHSWPLCFFGKLQIFSSGIMIKMIRTKNFIYYS